MSMLRDSFKWGPFECYGNKKPVMHEGTWWDPSFIVGLEVEVENVVVRHTYAAGKNFWDAKGDGSLRNNGMEFVSYPVMTDSLVTCVESFYSNIPPQFTFGQRTSLHVHVNVRDLSWDQFRTFLLAYCLTESVFFDVAGPDRAGGIFCVPILETQYPTRIIGKIGTSGTNLIPTWEKYSALNLFRLRDLGTVEFRHLGGTRDKSRVWLWLKLINCLSKFARSVDSKDFFNLINDYPAETILSRIFDNITIQPTVLAKPVRNAVSRARRDLLIAIEGNNIRAAQLAALSRESPFAKFLSKEHK